MSEKQTEVQPLSFSGCGYQTTYDCSCKSENIKMQKDGAPCFAAVFNSVKNEAEYNIRICTDPAILLARKSNYCPLSITDVIAWLDYICSIVDAKYLIHYDTMSFRYYNKDHYETRQFPCYNLYFHIHKGNNKKHKFALTAIRYLYEYPMNVILGEAFRLQYIEQFRNETLLNLHNLISCTFDGTRGPWGHGHSFTGNSKLISDDELKKKLTTNGSLNSMFDPADCFNDMTVMRYEYMLDYWESEDRFNKKRLPIYIHNYELLCKERENDLNKQ